MYTVQFKSEKKDRVACMLKNVEAGQSLLELALFNNIPLQHDCGGICACTTCHLYIEEGMEFIDDQSRREAAFVERAHNPRPNSRLACQSLLLNGHGQISLLLPEQTTAGSK
jgi:2Fe-2S ferredoxin